MSVNCFSSYDREFAGTDQCEVYYKGPNTLYMHSLIAGAREHGGLQAKFLRKKIENLKWTSPFCALVCALVW